MFLFPTNISPLVNLSDGLGVCLGMCSLFMRAVLVIQMPSGKGHTLKSFSASFYKSFMAFVIHLNNKRLLKTQEDFNFPLGPLKQSES